MDASIPAFIKELNNSDDLRKVMANAKTQNREDVRWAAFRRLCKVQGMNYDDPLHKDFYEVLAAYEELLTEKNERTTKASRTRQKLARHSIEKCLEDWALSPTPTQGFSMLIANGMSELTAEYLVVKYKERFGKEVVDAAKKRLGQI